MNRSPVPRLALLFVLAFAALAGAAQLKYVAVFETMADRDSVLDEADLRYLTNELRKLALEKLTTATYSVMTRDNILSLIPPDKNAAECFEGQCLVEIGRNVGADYAVQGTVSKFDGKLTLTVEAYATMSGNLVGSFTSESQTASGLLDAMREKSPALFAGIQRANGDEVAVATEPAPEAPPAPPPPAVVVAPAPPPAPVQSIDPQIGLSQGAGQPSGGSSWNHWVGVGLDVLGAAGFAFGLYQNNQVTE
jgi:hypothetical protein